MTVRQLTQRDADNFPALMLDIATFTRALRSNNGYTGDALNLRDDLHSIFVEERERVAVALIVGVAVPAVE